MELLSSLASPCLVCIHAKQEETFKTLKVQGQGGETKSSGPRTELVKETLLQISLTEKQFSDDYRENS